MVYLIGKSLIDGANKYQNRTQIGKILYASCSIYLSRIFRYNFCNTPLPYTFGCSITVLASCVMNLKDFPLDKQECQLKFGSCK